MFGLIANIGMKAYGLYQNKKAMEQQHEDYQRQLKVNKALAAEQLAITYNSIQLAALENGQQARRQEFKILAQARQAEGQLEVQAAQAGVAGRRAVLARKMAVAGGAERMMTELQIDTKRANDQLIARAEMEERATINRLISNTPDVPNTDMTSNVLSFAGGVWDDYNVFKENNQIQEDAIVLGESAKYSTDVTSNLDWTMPFNN